MQKRYPRRAKHRDARERALFLGRLVKRLRGSAGIFFVRRVVSSLGSFLRNESHRGRASLGRVRIELWEKGAGFGRWPMLIEVLRCASGGSTIEKRSAKEEIHERAKKCSCGAWLDVAAGICQLNLVGAIQQPDQRYRHGPLGRRCA